MKLFCVTMHIDIAISWYDNNVKKKKKKLLDYCANIHKTYS